MMHDPNGMDEERLERLLRAVPRPEPHADLADQIVNRAMLLPQVKQTSLLLRVLNALDSVGGGYALKPAFCSLVAAVAFTFGMADGYYGSSEEEDYSVGWYEDMEVTGDAGDVGGA